MPMEYTRNKKFLETPSLEMMTETAIKVISKNENGFFLMVCISPKINKKKNMKLKIIITYKTIYHRINKYFLICSRENYNYNIANYPS